MKFKNIIAIIIIVLLLIISLGYMGIKSINNFFTNNQLVFNQVLKVETKMPVEIKRREPIIEKQILSYLGEIDTDIKKYICDKFGVYECKTALAIAQAESGLREDAIYVNINQTIDMGIFQINSIHFKKAGCSPKELLDQYKNVDCAFIIWKSSGWYPWVSYVNGAYLIKLAERK